MQWERNKTGGQIQRRQGRTQCREHSQRQGLLAAQESPRSTNDETNRPHRPTFVDFVVGGGGRRRR